MVFVPKRILHFFFNLNLILIGPNLLFSLSSRTSFSSSSVTFRFLILCGFLDWFFNPSVPYASYRLFHLYHVSLETPNAMQTSDTVLPERSGSIIRSVNYVRKLKCQPCVEGSTILANSTVLTAMRGRTKGKNYPRKINEVQRERE